MQTDAGNETEMIIPFHAIIPTSMEQCQLWTKQLELKCVKDVRHALCKYDFHDKYHLDSIIFLTKATAPTQIDLMNISHTERLELLGV